MSSDRVRYSVLDAEGASGVSEKWLHVFRDVSCVFFVVPLSAYDSKIEADHKTVRLDSLTTSNAAAETNNQDRIDSTNH